MRAPAFRRTLGRCSPIGRRSRTRTCEDGRTAARARGFSRSPAPAPSPSSSSLWEAPVRAGPPSLTIVIVRQACTVRGGRGASRREGRQAGAGRGRRSAPTRARARAPRCPIRTHTHTRGKRQRGCGPSHARDGESLLVEHAHCAPRLSVRMRMLSASSRAHTRSADRTPCLPKLKRTKPYIAYPPHSVPPPQPSSAP